MQEGACYEFFKQRTKFTKSCLSTQSIPQWRIPHDVQIDKLIMLIHWFLTSVGSKQYNVMSIGSRDIVPAKITAFTVYGQSTL